MLKFRKENGLSAQPWDIKLTRLEGSYEQIDKRLGDLNARMATLEERFDGRIDGLERRFDGRIDGLEQRFDSRMNGLEDRLDTRFGGLDGRIDGMDRRMEGMDKKIDSVQGRLIAIIFAGWTTTILTILFHH